MEQRISRRKFLRPSNKTRFISHRAHRGHRDLSAYGENELKTVLNSVNLCLCVFFIMLDALTNTIGTTAAAGMSKFSILYFLFWI